MNTISRSKGPLFHTRVDEKTLAAFKELRKKYDYASNEAVLMDAAKALLALTKGEELPQWAKEGLLPNGKQRRTDETPNGELGSRNGSTRAG